MQTAVWRYWPRCAALHPASGGRVTDRRLILEVTVRERLAAAVLDDEAFPVLFRRTRAAGSGGASQVLASPWACAGPT